MKVTLLGAGAWGTAMASQAARHLLDGDVCLWSRSADQLKAIEQSGENRSYLPGIELPKNLTLESSLSSAIKRLSVNDLLVIATPMSGLSETVAQVLKNAEHPLNIIWLCKGLEPATALLPHQSAWPFLLTIHSMAICRNTILTGSPQNSPANMLKIWLQPCLQPHSVLSLIPTRIGMNVKVFIK